MKKIFRTNLNLSDKWWHRLFKILFVFSIICFFYFSYIAFLEESQNHYGRVSNLEDRLTDGVVKIDEVLRSGERFTDSGWQGEEDFWREGIYCSNNLSNIDNINYIIDDTGIDNFNRLRNNKNSIDVQSFSMILRSTDVKCITTDNAEIDFLNPMRHFDNFGFYKKNKFQYLKDSIFLSSFLINLSLYLIIIYILYYWIFMYIVLGAKNKS